MKVCTKCGKSKSVDEFYRASGMRDGRRGDCKQCNAAASAKRHAADPERAIQRVQAWKAANPERARALQERHTERRKTPVYRQQRRAQRLESVYGLTVAEAEELLVVVDVGGLCGPCNRGLGLFSDDVSKLEAAIAYLKGGQ